MSKLTEILQEIYDCPHAEHIKEHTEDLNAYIAEVIGPDPDYGDKQPLWLQKVEAQVRKVKAAQRKRAGL